jgi:hypothetical protein
LPASAPQAEPPAVLPSEWNSAIISGFPKLFEHFKTKQFALLWRSSRDGFGADDFYMRCDWHPNTLIVILDTKGNIIGGFTPVKWKSTCTNRSDASRTSFLFMLSIRRKIVSEDSVEAVLVLHPEQ